MSQFSKSWKQIHKANFHSARHGSRVAIDHLSGINGLCPYNYNGSQWADCSIVGGWWCGVRALSLPNREWWVFQPFLYILGLWVIQKEMTDLSHDSFLIRFYIWPIPVPKWSCKTRKTLKKAPFGFLGDFCRKTPARNTPHGSPNWVYPTILDSI